MKGYLKHTNQKIRNLATEIIEFLFSKIDDPVEIISKMYFVGLRDYLKNTLETKYNQTQKFPPLFSISERHTQYGKGMNSQNNHHFSAIKDSEKEIEFKSNSKQHYGSDTSPQTCIKDNAELNNILPEKF